MSKKIKIGSGSFGISSDEWLKLEEMYKNGFAFCSQWLEKFGIYDKAMPKKLVEEEITKELQSAIITCANSVNIVRHTYGCGPDNFIAVSWHNNNATYIDLPFSVASIVSPDAVIYLDPAPIKCSSDYTCHQRYDAVIGDGLLQSARKKILDKNSFFFMNYLHKLGSLSIIEAISDTEIKLTNTENKSIVSHIKSPEPFLFPMNSTTRTISGNMLRFVSSLFTAVELIVSEKNLMSNYPGSSPYIYAHRSFYKSKNYLNKLQTLSSQVKYAKNDIAFLNLLYTLINPTDKWKRHKFYYKFSKICLNLLCLNPNSTSEERLHSVICTIMTGLWLLGNPKEWLDKQYSNDSEGVTLPFQMPISEKEMEQILNDLDSQKDPTPTQNKYLEYLRQKLEESGLPYSEIGEDRQSAKSVKNSIPMDVSKAESEARKTFYASLFGSTIFNTVPPYQSNNDRYNNFVSKNYYIIEELKEILRVVSFCPSYQDPCLRSGYLDEAALYKLNDPESDDIFYQETIVKKTEKAAITILMDQSASMGASARIDHLTNIAIIIAESLGGRSNIKLRFFGFNNSQVLDYNQHPFNYTLGAIRSNGSTREGESVAEVIALIIDQNLKEEGYDEYFFVIGDGKSDQKSSHKAFSFSLSSGVNILHFGLDNAYDIEYGNSVYGSGRFAILPTKNLLNAFVSIFSQFLLR